MLSKKITFFLLLNLFILNVYAKDPNQGLLITAMGLPCSGKSTICRELSQKLNVPVFLEVEEKQWEKAVFTRKDSGDFTMISWFRSMRVPELYQADNVRQRGGVAIVDSYYDKLLHLYLGHTCMEWLIKKEDPYFDVLKQLAQLDYNLLPDADVIIFFELTEATWKKFLQKRNRQLDNDEDLKKSFALQAVLLKAAQQYAKQKGKQLIHFQQDFSSVKEATEKLIKQLKQQGSLFFGK